VKGWGTLCGALNGACAVISLVVAARASGRVIDELILWYTQTPLPSGTSNDYGVRHRYGVDKNIPLLPHSTSGSPLCHVSTTKWCVRAGHSVESPERYERCARLSGDVAAQAVMLLNNYQAGGAAAGPAIPQETAACLDCHGPKSRVQNVASKMDCSPCHTVPHP
jgi:hypothetical protein